jgi:hypothetical protein
MKRLTFPMLILVVLLAVVCETASAASKPPPQRTFYLTQSSVKATQRLPPARPVITWHLSGRSTMYQTSGTTRR